MGSVPFGMGVSIRAILFPTVKLWDASDTASLLECHAGSPVQIAVPIWARLRVTPSGCEATQTPPGIHKSMEASVKEVTVWTGVLTTGDFRRLAAFSETGAPDQLACLKVSSHTSSSFPSIDQVQTAVSLLIVTLANQNTCRPTIITTITKYIV